MAALKSLIALSKSPFSGKQAPDCYRLRYTHIYDLWLWYSLLLPYQSRLYDSKQHHDCYRRGIGRFMIYGCVEVLYSLINHTFTIVSSTTIVIGGGIGRVHFYGFGIVCYCLINLTYFPISKPTMVIDLFQLIFMIYGLYSLLLPY